MSTSTLSASSIPIPLEGNALLKPISHTVNHYDGEAFEGLSVGEIGDHGALVKTETLVIRDEQINEAYGTDTPECFKPIPDYSGYPTIFGDGLQNDDKRLGYKKYFSSENYVEGWYRTDVRNKYDFQGTTAPLSPHPRGLVQMTKDVFDNKSEIIYDDYGFLPVEARQYYDNNTPKYLSTSAEYDYRLFKPIQVKDENTNRSRFDYSPLGLLKGIALIGQEGKSQGDIVSEDPLEYVCSTQFEYNLMQFVENKKPVWIKTIQREKHWQQDPSLDSPTIKKIEFSDGFGRIAQSRAQAEDTLFRAEDGIGMVAGSSRLPIDQSATNEAAVAVKKGVSLADNVVISGWKIYNNKGKVVQEYEPFFGTGYDYQGSKYYRNTLQKMTIRYDAGGRPTETHYPDGSKSLMVHGIPFNISSPNLYGANEANGLMGVLEPNGFHATPWERYSYDQNDLATLTPTATSYTSRAIATHYGTPKSELVDALGRTIKTTEHKSQIVTGSGENENVVMKYAYDIQGNLKTVHDPMDRLVFWYKYNLQKQALFTQHIDAGISRLTPDVLGKPVITIDAKGALSLSSFDRLQRPLNTYTRDNSASVYRMSSRITYAEYHNSLTEPIKLARNLNGKIYQSFDDGGMDLFYSFDFKGNNLQKRRYLLLASELKSTFSGAPSTWTPYLIDWQSVSGKYDTNYFRQDYAYDAMNRITSLRLPADVNDARNYITPTYNTAGGLEKVDYDGTEYVKNIGYNAKGQRTIIAFGNNTMTRYAYDPKTFRLARQRTEKCTITQQGRTTTYTPDAGTTRQDEGFQYDLVGNIIKILDRRNDCGISGSTLGSNALDRDFTYDPLYRLTSATGRESDTQHENDYLYADAPAPGSPNADNVRAYTRKYKYDKIGNVMQMKQLGSNGFTRNFNYNEAEQYNTLLSIETGSESLIQDFTYDAVGNQLKAGDIRNYIWTAANSLLAYYNQAGSATPTVYAQYQYDGGGNRVGKLVRTGAEVAPIWERVVYIDGIFEYHKLEETSTTYEKNYVHVMDDKSRICMVRIGTPFPDDIADATTYVLENQIGSSVARLNTSGGVIDIEEYYPFGDSSLRTFTKKRYQYCGKEKDSESGLYYYGARYYAAWTCRFISVDPLAADYPFYTPYNYAGNKPINKVDIDGMQEQAPKQEKQQTKVDAQGMIERLNILVKRVDKQLNEAFKKSEEPKAGEEWFGIGVSTKEGPVDAKGNYGEKIYLKNVETLHESSNTDIDYNTSKGETLLFDFHTHHGKYHGRDEQWKGLGPSSRDIFRLSESIENLGANAGWTSIIESGDTRFALVIVDLEKATEFFENNSKEKLSSAWREARNKAYAEGMTDQEAAEYATQEVLGDSDSSGIGFYKTTDTEKVKFQQLNGSKSESKKK